MKCNVDQFLRIEQEEAKFVFNERVERWVHDGDAVRDSGRGRFVASWPALDMTVSLTLPFWIYEDVRHIALCEYRLLF